MTDRIKCICGEVNFKSVFTHKFPPSKETAFSFINTAGYHREILMCLECGHFISVHDMKIGEIYNGEYVRAKYMDLRGVRRTFNKINELPPTQSDNNGRVKNIIQIIKKHFYKKNDVSILDVGSGLGIFPYSMEKKGWNITALDPDPVACAHISGLGVDTIMGDFLMVRAKKKYDLVTFNRVVEHIKEPIGFLHHAKEFLKDKGLIYIEVPNGEKAARDEEGYNRQEFVVEHYHSFSKRSLEKLIENAGFSQTEQQEQREPSGKYTLRTFGVKK